MSIACQIVRNEQGQVTNVLDPNGNESKLYRDALEHTKDHITALDLWTIPYMEEYAKVKGDWQNKPVIYSAVFVDKIERLDVGFSGTVGIFDGSDILTPNDLNREPDLREVLSFLNFAKNSNKRLTKKQVEELSNNLITLDVGSMRDLYNQLRSTYYPNGVFKVSRSRLTASGIYTPAEVNEIVSSEGLQNQIKGLLELMQIEYLNETDSFQKVDSHVTPNSEDALVKAGQPIGIGKFRVIDPYEVRQTIAKDLAGVTDRDVFDSLVSELPYPGISEKYFNDRDYADSFFERYSQLKRVPTYEIKDGELVQSVTGTTQDALVETLRTEVDPTNLRDNIDTLNRLEDWDKAKPILKNIEIEVSKYNIDIAGLQDTFTTKSREDILLLVNILNEFSRGVEHNLISESDVRRVAEITDEFFERTDSPVITYREIPEQNRDKTLLDITTAKTPLEMFQGHSVIKTKEGLWQKVNNSQNLTKLYETVYEVVKSNPKLLPEAAYYPAAFNRDNTFNPDKMNPENREAITQSIQKYIRQEMAKNPEYMTPENSESLERMTVFQKLFGHPTGIQFDPETEVINKLEQFRGNHKYLTGKFIADFRTKVIREKIKKSQLYDKVLRHFRFTKDGIGTTTKDPNFISNVRLLSPDTKVFNDLRNYSLISKDLGGLYGVKTDSTANPSSMENKRRYVANNPLSVKKLNTPYRVENGLLSVPNVQDDFIRVREGLFEKIDGRNGISYFRQIPSVTESPFYQIDLKSPKRGKIDYQNPKLQALENPIRNRNLYSKIEAARIKEKIDSCG